MKHRGKVVVGAMAVVGLLAVMVTVGWLAVALAPLDTTRELSDFASATEARNFTSAYLPLPLPQGARIEALRYERWTDWRLTARARFGSAAALDDYLSDARRRRALDDQYCGVAEPPGGLRYVVSNLRACGSLERVSERTLQVTCFTR
jgi:hypothetical protein